MKKLLLILCFLFPIFTGCGEDTYNVNVERKNNAADGLDLEEIIILTKSITKAEELEFKINEPRNPYNKVDYDDDDVVDYVNVTGYGDREGLVRGFSFTVATSNTDTQEIATIDIEKDTNGKVSVNAHGNSAIYGDGHHYHHDFDAHDYLLYAALFHNPYPTFYTSPYRYGYYPPTYSRVEVREIETVRTVYKRQPKKYKIERVSQPVFRNEKVKQSYAQLSPNKDKVATNIKAVLAKPTESQRVFQIKNPPQKRIEVKAFDKRTGSPVTTIKSTASSIPSVGVKKSYTNSGSRISVGGFGKSSSNSSKSSSSSSSSKSTSSSSSKKSK